MRATAELRTPTATLRDENVAFFQIGLFRDTSDVPETIYIDHVIEATTLAEVTPFGCGVARRPERLAAAGALPCTGGPEGGDRTDAR